MKIENDLRTMASFLQAQLKDVETLIAQEKEGKAQEALNFTQGGLKNFANEIEKVDGGFYGLVGILFRRAYHVPDDIKKLREALFQEAERLQKLLAKNSEKNRNKLDRNVAKAAKALQTSELAILPTETVYGLFANALDEKAVKKLYAVKGRPTEKALNMNVASYADILKYSKHQPVYLEKLVGAFLPGPLTIILEASSAVPEWIHIGKTTVGFRMPSIKITQKVIEKVGVLVGPSANLTGDPSPQFFADLSPQILENAQVAIQDDSIYGLDTTIIDLTGKTPRLLRQGAITRERLLREVPELADIQ